ncbi:MAG: DUF3343 domain-containing protein [Bacteroidales bacterium]|jgi:hypothetical protein|nr:DUF3343 domain-containing protein [Bacteroidales bacterium]
MRYFILIFESTHHVLKAEKVFTGMGIKFDSMPVPKEISSDCGIAIRIDPALFDEHLITSILKKNDINFQLHEKIYK